MGLASLVLNPDTPSSFGGIMIKVGLMLAATWLALPNLVKPENQPSMQILGGFLLLVVLVAIRPKIFIAVLVIGAIAFALNSVMKRMADKR